MPNNTNTGSKKIYNSADLVNMAQKDYDAINEQDILNKYNQATSAQFAAQQDQNRIAENNFYNQMYNTQRTAMDTIRQSNATAVSTGASRGVQAANELSALLGLQQESMASATEIANARRQTAQEETAAMLQNVVQASQDAATQRQQALQSMIQAQSLRESELANASAAADRQLKAVKEGGKTYTMYLEQEGKLGPDGEFAQQGYTPESDQYIHAMAYSDDLKPLNNLWSAWDYHKKTGGYAVANTTRDNVINTVNNICENLNITDTEYQAWKATQPNNESLPNTLTDWITERATNVRGEIVGNWNNYDVAEQATKSSYNQTINSVLNMNALRAPSAK